MSKKPPRRPKTIRVVAEGEAEVAQLLRRMKAGAWRIEGAAGHHFRRVSRAVRVG